MREQSPAAVGIVRANKRGWPFKIALCALFCGALGTIDGSVGVQLASLLTIALCGASMAIQASRSRASAQQAEAAVLQADNDRRRLEQQAEAERVAARRLRDEEGRRIFEQAELARQQQWSSLCDRYGLEIATRIRARSLWVGCTLDMVVAMLGAPLAVEEHVLKTKTKKTFKYIETGKSRYALRVVLENDVVTGWDDRR
jgi:hypothetical protein